MRFSDGTSIGRYAELSHPKIFQEHEEVIVFTREQFGNFYNSVQEQIKYLNGIDLYFDQNEEWKLLGLWPKIMERVHILDVNMDSLIKKEPLQCYLDAELYETIVNPSKSANVVVKKKLPIQQTLQI
ncbi:MAG: hypothetical protein NKF70_12580 [Methanobacterium sp. ERen5]|nr:MAG: hypothetical protein NKF70_12580 [Methanobacterium sp. ERen5]